MNFSQSSLDKLSGVHHDLSLVAHKALEYGLMDFAIVQGLRTKADQEALYAQGRTAPGKIVTWTLQSKHLPQLDGLGHALDIVPVINGRLDWITIENFKFLATLIMRAAMEVNALVKWGGHFPDGQRDWDHFEIITE